MKAIQQKIKLVLGITAAMFSIAFLLDATAGGLEPPAAPAKTMKTLDEVEARVILNETNTPGDTTCVFKISQPGSYYLAGNTSVDTWENGIEIAADNVTLDLNGYQLTSASILSYSGIVMIGRSNIEIRNGTIRNFGWNGIRGIGSGSQYHRIINMRVFSNGFSGLFTGIYLLGNNHLVKDCTATGNANNGISVGIGSTVTGNNCYDNNIGINTGEGCTVIGNTVRSNTASGITVGNYCYIDQNTATGNTPNLTFGTGCKGTNVAP